MPSSLCGSLAFDSRGPDRDRLPVDPAPAAGADHRPRHAGADRHPGPADGPEPAGTNAYQNFAGGGYFFLDNKDRIWVATKTDHIFMLDEGRRRRHARQAADYDLTGVLDESTERITSALPDFHGRIWFVSKQNGKVGTLDREDRRRSSVARARRGDRELLLGRPRGVYIVSNKRMYRFKAQENGKPKIVWQAKYPNSGIVKPSQVDAGSGTTPTIMAGGYVAITDNADPMNVVVYRTAKNLKHGQKRAVCQVPVFDQGASATENSLIRTALPVRREQLRLSGSVRAQRRARSPRPGSLASTSTGTARAARKMWTNHDVRSPTVVPKLSTKTGLIYTYQRPEDPADQGYFWTAIDCRTGKTAWAQYAGSGLLFNNNYAGLALGPDGTAYLGVIGGIMALRDGG